MAKRGEREWWLWEPFGGNLITTAATFFPPTKKCRNFHPHWCMFCPQPLTTSVNAPSLLCHLPLPDGNLNIHNNDMLDVVSF